MRIKIWHIERPADDAGKLGQARYGAATLGTCTNADVEALWRTPGVYWLAGIVEVQPNKSRNEELEDAYAATQHDQARTSLGWHREPGVQIVINARFGDPRRSSMVGDIFELEGGELFRVASSGFARVNETAPAR